MLRNESFYKRYFGDMNLFILRHIEDIKANKGNRTAEFWEGKLKVCQCNPSVMDIKSLKQAIVRNRNCPTYVIEEILLFETDKDIMFDALDRTDITDTKLMNYIISSITPARIKREFKNAIKENRAPKISKNFCQHMAYNYESDKFDGYPFRYCSDAEKIKEKISQGELCENALTEVINNEWLPFTVREQAFETGFNYTRLTNVPNSLIQSIFESATSTLYDFDSSDKSLQNARIQAHNTLNYLIENNLLKDSQEIELYDYVTKDADKGNQQTNNAFMRRLLPKTNCNFLLEKAFIDDIYKNPKIAPSRLIFIINSIITNELKYKKCGSPAYINALSKIRTFYENYRNNHTKESEMMQKNLIDFLKENEENKKDSSVWAVYLTMAQNPHTSRENLEYIEKLYPKYQMSVMASFSAKLMNEFHKMSIDINELEAKNVVKYFFKRDGEYPDIKIEFIKELQKFTEKILDDGTYKIIKKEIKDFRKALDEMEEDYNLYGKQPCMFAKDSYLNAKTWSGYAFCATKFMHLTKGDKEKFYNALGEKQIKRLRTVIQNQMKCQIDRTDMYYQMTDLAESSTELLEMLKEKTGYYKSKENAIETENEKDDRIKAVLDDIEL